MAYYDIDAILTDAQVWHSSNLFVSFVAPFEKQISRWLLIMADGGGVLAGWGDKKLPCTFELEVPGLGYLDGNVGEDVCYSLFFPL